MMVEERRYTVLREHKIGTTPYIAIEDATEGMFRQAQGRDGTYANPVQARNRAARRQRRQEAKAEVTDAS